MTAISTAEGLGKYAPKTELNNYFVFVEDTLGSRVLAHSFAHIRNPERYEFIVDSIQNAWDMLYPSQETVHPSYQWMQNTFSFLTEA